MTEKQFTKRPDWSQLESIWLDRYDGSNYERGLSAWVLRHTHSLVENDQNLQDNYPVVLELGVGTMAHFPFVRHWFEEYIASDHDPKVIDWLNSRTWDGRVSITQFDSSEIPLEDNSVDRVIMAHVLEHVNDPVGYLEEVVRVVKKGGVISIILPCDPGFLWQAGRSLGPRRKSKKQGIPYDYYMSVEHKNSIQNLKNIIKFHFPVRKETWWPTRFPLPEFNLIYSVNCYL